MHIKQLNDTASRAVSEWAFLCRVMTQYSYAAASPSLLHVVCKFCGDRRKLRTLCTWLKDKTEKL